SKISPEDTATIAPYNSTIYGGRGRRHIEPEEPAQPGAPEIRGGNAFQSEFTDTTTTVSSHKRRHNTANNIADTTEGKAEDSTKLTIINDSTYLKMRAAQYRLSFKPDNFTVRVDNSV